MAPPSVSPSYKLPIAKVHQLCASGEKLLLTFPGASYEKKIKDEFQDDFDDAYHDPYEKKKIKDKYQDASDDDYYDAKEDREELDDREQYHDEEPLPTSIRKAIPTPDPPTSKYDFLQTKDPSQYLQDLIETAGHLRLSATATRARYAELKNHLSNIAAPLLLLRGRPVDQANMNFDALFNFRAEQAFRRNLDKYFSTPSMAPYMALRRTLGDTFVRASPLADHLASGKPLMQLGSTYVDIHGLEAWISSGQPLPADGYQFHTAGNPFLKTDGMNARAQAQRQTIINRFIGRQAMLDVQPSEARAPVNTAQPTTGPSARKRSNPDQPPSFETHDTTIDDLEVLSMSRFEERAQAVSYLFGHTKEKDRQAKKSGSHKEADDLFEEAREHLRSLNRDVTVFADLHQRSHPQDSARYGAADPQSRMSPNRSPTRRPAKRPRLESNSDHQ